jgi:hypothetical protein
MAEGVEITPGVQKELRGLQKKFNLVEHDLGF